MSDGSRTAWMKVDEVVTVVDPGYVFPQGITGHDGKEIRRAGGLTKRELASIIFGAHEVAMCDLFQATGILKKEAALEMRQRAVQAGIDAADIWSAAMEKPRA